MPGTNAEAGSSIAECNEQRLLGTRLQHGCNAQPPAQQLICHLHMLHTPCQMPSPSGW